MARLARAPTIWSDNDDEFPDLDALVSAKKLQKKKSTSTAQLKPKARTNTEEPVKPPASVRRRKLGPLTDNLLLRAWTPDSAEGGEEDGYLLQENEGARPRRARVELRTRNTTATAVIPSSPADQAEKYLSAREEVTIIEEVSTLDDTFHSCRSEGSEFRVYEDESGEYEDDDEDSGMDFQPRKLPAKPSFFQVKSKKLSRGTQEDAVDKGMFEEEDNTARRTSARQPSKRQDTSSKAARGTRGEGKAKKADKDLADTLSKLRLDEIEERHSKNPTPRDRDVTPPPILPLSRPGLASPRKLPRIPTTPHRPSSDMFWSQEFVDDWNDEHSPRKQLFPDAVAARQKSPIKDSLENKSLRSTTTKKAPEREARKAFEMAKHNLADKFLRELDTVITDGKLAKLAESTGGIKVVWTNKLNTTAGRANWKRETIRTNRPNDTAAPSSTTTTTDTRHKHHASIELAEKVIDDEHRLLNVIAHEFCHLANFMISGVTTNPHGREFKAWAARVSRAFGERGIEVTTKHSYDIDFKYVWECVACGTEFKRHSRSIDPSRHRCGSCKEELRQTKPAPRKKKDGEAPSAAKKVSEYQAFMKEQMRIVKEENPSSPQKEIMKIVASRWAAQKSKALLTPTEGVQAVAGGLEELTV